MNEVARAGRTILFVSHDLSAVNSLCKRAILLHDGAMVLDGPTREVTAHYLDTSNKLYSPITWADAPPGKNDEILLQNVTINQRGENTSAIDCREPFTIAFEYETRQALPNSRFFILVRNARGEVVFGTSDYDLANPDEINRKPGRFLTEVAVPGEFLKAGSYFGTIGADIKNERIIFADSDIVQFEVYESGHDTLSERHRRPGLIAPLLKWQTSETGPQQN